MTLRWGICCSGLISQDFTSAICEYESPRNRVVAVAARNIDKARLFADRFQIEHYFDRYESLALCESVDIVYVGSVDSEHCKLTKLFLNHGKHVLVEKSMALNVTETLAMIELARKKKLFLMEGLWSVFFPIYKRIQESTADGLIGTILHANANFHYNMKSERVWSKDVGCGGLKSLGIYVIKFALWAFHDKELKKISGNIKKEDGIDVCGNILLEFEGNGTAFVSYHGKATGDTSASVYGDTGSIVIPNHFWCPEDFIVNGKEDQSLRTKRKDLKYSYNYEHSWGFIHEIDSVADCIAQGFLESPIHPLSETIKLAEIMENLLKEK